MFKSLWKLICFYEVAMIFRLGTLTGRGANCYARKIKSATNNSGAKFENWK